MAREATRIVDATAWLRAEVPLHVGGAAGNAETDLALAVDGYGRTYVPGTSLAGALRTWWLRSFGETSTREVWGWVPSRRGPMEVTTAEATRHGAARLLVHDAVISTQPQQAAPAPETAALPVEVRSGVGIERWSGAAASGFLYTRAVVPCGCWLRLGLRLEASCDEQLGRLAAMLVSLSTRGLRVGAGRTRGLGRMRLHEDRDFSWQEQDLTSPDRFLDFLLEPTSASWDDVAGRAVQPTADQRVSITVRWRPDGPLLVRSGAEGLGVDSVPLVSQLGDKVHLVVPGSAIKGALRSRAEMILRTVAGRSALRDPDERERLGGRTGSTAFLNELAGSDLAVWLFGAAAVHEHGRRPVGLEPGLGALAVDDCFATAGVDAALWASVYRDAAKDSMGRLRHAENFNQAGLYETMHVAVDRWTGGAVASRLFSVLEPHATAYEPIRMDLDLGRLKDENDRDSAVALVLLTLRDLRAGRFGLGFGTHRGLGAVIVDSIEIEGYAQLGRTAVEDLPPAVVRTLQEAWTRYLRRAGAA